MNKKICTAIIAAATLLSAGYVSASVTPFAISGTYTQGGGSSDIPQATISLGGAGSFVLDPGASGNYFDFSQPGGGTFSTINTQIGGYYFLRSYAPGEIVGPLNFGNQTSTAGDWDTILVDDQTAGVWDASNDGALGFETASGQFGYIDYSFTRSGQFSTITFLDGAYESNQGLSIAVPGATVPEPGSIALLSLGLLGFAASRRKSAKK